MRLGIGELKLRKKGFWGAEGAPILFSEIGFCMASCSYIYIYIYIYICMYVCIYIYLSRWRRRGVR